MDTYILVKEGHVPVMYQRYEKNEGRLGRGVFHMKNVYVVLSLWETKKITLNLIELERFRAAHQLLLPIYFKYVFCCSVTQKMHMIFELGVS